MYVHDNSAITRAPALVLTYLCMFLKLRTMENLKEAERLLKQYHQMTSPNINAIKALLKKHQAFVDKQRHFLGDCDSSDDDRANRAEEEGIFLQRRKEYNKKSLPDVQMADEQQFLFERDEPLIEFNGRPGNPLDVAVQEVIQST